MPKEYETFVRDTARVPTGRATAMTLRDLTPGRKKYRGINVRAVISRPAKAGEDKLWIRSVVGVREPQAASVRIVEELPDTFAAPAYSDYFQALEKAGRR